MPYARRLPMLHLHTILSVATISSPTPPRCQGNWPLFEDRNALENNLWADYFKAVYGGIPSEPYPLCVGDWWMIYDDIVRALNITDIPNIVGDCPTKFKLDGQRYRGKNKYWPPYSSWVWHASNTSNPSQPRTPFSNNTWVEVMHHSAPKDEQAGAWSVLRRWLLSSCFYSRLRSLNRCCLNYTSIGWASYFRRANTPRLKKNNNNNNSPPPTHTKTGSSTLRARGYGGTLATPSHSIPMQKRMHFSTQHRASTPRAIPPTRSWPEMLPKMGGWMHTGRGIGTVFVPL